MMMLLGKVGLWNRMIAAGASAVARIRDSWLAGVWIPKRWVGGWV